MIDVFDNIFQYTNNLTVSGLNVSLINEYILNYFNKYNRNVLVVTDSLYDANKIYRGIHKLNKNVYFFPMDEFATVAAVSASPDLKIIRIDTLNQIGKDNNIIVTNISGYLKLVDVSVNSLDINFNTKRKDIIDFLEDNSYVKTNLVTTTGEYALRSYILDIFPLNNDNPIRIEFFGEDIESIRIFDTDTQISKGNIDSASLYSFSDESCINIEHIIDKLSN